MNTDPNPLRYGYTQTQHGQVHYAEAGEGPTLLLLGESPRSHRYFRKLLPLLAPHFRCIAIDTPGYGRSHAAPSPLTVEAVTACVADFLAAAGIEHTHLLGVNTGNKIGALLAADWPQRIGRVALVGYSHSIIPEQAARNAAIEPIFRRYAPRFAPSEDGAHLARQWLATKVYADGLWWPPHLLTGATVSDDDIAAAEAEVIDYLMGWRSVVPMYRAIFDFDLGAAFARIAAPTLVVELTTPQERHLEPQAERVCRTMRDATPAMLEVTFGRALDTDAQALAQLVAPFLLS